MDGNLTAWLSGVMHRRSDWYIKLCQELVRIPSPNPPGDTTCVADYAVGLLKDAAIPHEIHWPQHKAPNLMATLGTGKGPSLILNAHMDVFPVQDPLHWSGEPFSGEVRDGRLYGRGSSDMKAGLAAALGTCLVLAEEATAWEGTLRLTLVSDEENGGAWGTGWLLEHVPEAIGDACLIGEPTGWRTPAIGEKAPLWLRVTTSGPERHGAYSDGRDANWQMAQVIRVLQAIHEEIHAPPTEIAGLVDEMQRQARASGSGRAWWPVQPSVNFGCLRGGAKVNVAPASSVLDLDIRVPFGDSCPRMLAGIRRRLAEAGIDAGIEVLLGEGEEPNFTDWQSPFARVVFKAIEDAGAPDAQPTLAPYLTDGRLFRRRGVPTLAYGPHDYGMGAADEHVEIAEYLKIVQVFLLTAVRYCGVQVRAR